MNTTMKGIAVAIGASLTFGVQASYIGIDVDKPGVTETTLPANNSYANNPANNPELTVGQAGYAGATVEAFTDAHLSLTFTYLFKEAGFTNSFWYQGEQIFSTNDAFGSTYNTTYEGGAGALDFFFQAVGYNSTRTVSNLDNGTDEPKFNTYWDSGSNTIYLGLDDHGAGPDNDHDDMIMKITASPLAVPVPEPGTLALLGLGLAGMGMRFGKRNKA